MRRPSTLMASLAMSALSPSAATWPLTVTRPAAMSSSVGRRGGLAAALGGEELLHLLEGRQVAQRPETEVEQELARRGVEERLADHLLAPGDADEAALEQGLDHGARLHAAQLGHLGAGE